MSKRLIITGIRGIPAQHGGFETFAERLALYLVQRGWDVTVYCQSSGLAHGKEVDFWNGVRLVRLRERRGGAFGTVLFDLESVREASRQEGLILTLGYNTAVFNLWFRLQRRLQVINMDGIEWRRPKWSTLEKMWLYMNERVGCLVGNRLVADHPRIAAHLMTRVSESKIVTIPYGSDEAVSAPSDSDVLGNYGLREREYSLLIARPEPENQFLEIVRAYSSRPRRWKLVVLGNFLPEQNAYHAQVIKAASKDVVFPGAIYDQDIVRALRANCATYVHGHTVGGTNPSLVEALGAGCAVIAHANQFNAWVCGEAGMYFRSEAELGDIFSRTETAPEELQPLRDRARARHAEEFTWGSVLGRYEAMLEAWT